MASEQVWSAVLGMGMLDMEPGKGERGKDRLTFTAAATGIKTTFEMVVIAKGPPKFLKVSAERKPDLTTEDENWRSYEMRDGTVMAFRFGGPPPPTP